MTRIWSQKLLIVSRWTDRVILAESLQKQHCLLNTPACVPKLLTKSRNLSCPMSAPVLFTSKWIGPQSLYCLPAFYTDIFLSPLGIFINYFWPKILKTYAKELLIYGSLVQISISVLCCLLPVQFPFAAQIPLCSYCFFFYFFPFLSDICVFSLFYPPPPTLL